MKRGLVISDLHLFSARSEGEQRFAEIRTQLIEVDTLVLNGDIFDFRWAVRSHAETIPEAIDWLEQLASDYPDLSIHFIPGNHDCLPEFVAGVDQMDSIILNSHLLILGQHLFLHGDAASYKMDQAGFDKFRKNWQNDRPGTPLKTNLYRVADRLKLSEVTHHIWFMGDIAINRITWHLDQVKPGWRDDISDCYFGHTHLPFCQVNKAGVLFHNTGAAIRGTRWKPMSFSY